MNVLDWRTHERKAAEIVEESIAAKDRGSISVALERENDRVREQLNGENVTDDEVSELMKNQKVPDELMSDSAMRNIFHKTKVEEKAQNLLASPPLKQEMEERAMNTIMAGIGKPNEQIAILSPGSQSYESSVPSGKIPAGSEGFTHLLIPEWYRPFYPMVEEKKPEEVEVKFVGNKKITAYYKYKDMQLPVEVEAPDYESEVTPLLEKFAYMATHILKA